MKRLSVMILAACCSGALCAEPAKPGQRPLTKRDVLSLVDGKFYLEGERFAEISFNKFDLFWALYGERLAGRELTPENPMVRAQDNALRNLSKLGFRSIRIFAYPWGENAAEKYLDPKTRLVIFEALDKTVELCQRNGIGIVWMLGCPQFTDEKEHLRELCADPQSANRKILYSYLHEVINRYKNSPAVLMWEVGNELTLGADIGDENGVFNGKRMPSLKDVSEFYDDVAKVIKQKDPLRLVNNGGSNPREYQWNLYKKKGWTRDTFGEQRKCFELLFKKSAIDVIDIHYYPARKLGVSIADNNGREKLIGLADYMAIAAQLNKPLMVGEIGRGLVPADNKEFWKESPDYFRTLSDAKALPWINELLEEIVNVGVPLSYWWAYQSDREMDRNDPLRMDVSIERNPELVAAIANANKRLKQKFRISP